MLLNYSTTDKYPMIGLSYYRLKQTDFDGQFSYSNISAVNIDRIGNRYFNIYPNPTDGLLVIEAEKSELESLRVYNSLGIDVTSLVSLVEISGVRMTLNLERFDTGIYYCKTNTMAQKILLKY